MFNKNFLVLFLSALVMITSIGATTTIDSSSNDNKAFGQTVPPGYNPQYGTSSSEAIVGTSGQDAQYGYDGNDYLYGDQQSVPQGTTTTGVSDIQYGGEGSDLIYGDATSVYNQNVNSAGTSTTTTLNGGNDVQYGSEPGYTSSTNSIYENLFGDVDSVYNLNNAYFSSSADGATATTTVNAGDDTQTVPRRRRL